MASGTRLLASIALVACRSIAQLLPPDGAVLLGETSGQVFSGAHTPDRAPAPDPHVVGPHHFCGLPEEQYSGYLGAGPGASYFFWLARSLRQRGAGERPVPLVMWISGGPGCSSTLAFLYENGPCRLDGHGDDGWRTHRDPFSWTEEAHVLWVDQPAGVGFSGGRSGLVDGESGVADHMYEFLGNFFSHFDDLGGDVPFFIFGESYAGHYIPAIAAKIVRENLKPGPQIPLEGIAIGNGLVVPMTQFVSQPEMAYTGGEGGSFHGVVDDATYQEMIAALPECRRQLDACDRTMTAASCEGASQACEIPMMTPILATGRSPYDLRISCPSDLQPMCTNLTYLTDYLNDPAIQATLGVVADTSWIPCSMDVGTPFHLSGDTFESYGPDVAVVLEHGVRAMLYYGDCDYMADWVGGKAWVGELDWPQRSAWNGAADTPFVVSGRQKGRVRSVGGLTFLQVWHSGHLVPHDQPEAALAMLREFVSASSDWAIPSRVEDGIRLSAGEPSGGFLLAAALAAGLASLSGLAAFFAIRRRTAASHVEDVYLVLE